MWLKRKKCETINLNFIGSIEKIVSSPTEYRPKIKYYIDFHCNNGKQKISYYFDSEHEMNEYADGIDTIIDAVEIPLLKI